MLENVKNFVSEKMEKVEDFCDDHFYTIMTVTMVGFTGAIAVMVNNYYKAVSNAFKGS